MAGLRERKKEKTRKAILDAAVKLFSKKGYENTSVDQLAREAGVGKSTIYGYFKTKNEIFLAFCEDEIEFAFGDLAQKNNPEAPLTDQLHTLFMSQFRYVTSNKDFGRVLAREMFFPKELTAKKSQDLDDSYLDAMGEILARAMKRGELRRDQEPLYLTGHFYALYLISLSAWYMGRLKDENEVAHALGILLSQAMEGLTPTKQSKKP